MATFAVNAVNDAKTWWANVSTWWDKATKDLSLGAAVDFIINIIAKLGNTAWDGVTDFWTWLSTGKMKGAKNMVGVGDVSASVTVSLVKGWNGTWKQALGINKPVLTIAAQFAKKGANRRIQVSAGGFNQWTLETKALGGIFANGLWKYIPQYAKGTLRAGSLFAAGERGPEVVGHIGGRTEVLNKSQLASTMFSAVENGILAAASRLRFRAPAMASGAVMPYEVAAQIAQSTADLQGTLDANNEDLIQTIISVVGSQTTAIVAALARLNSAGGGVSPQQVVAAINQQTLMFGASPLRGV